MESSKEVPIEELPKEELIKKYRKLLLLAQKAKQSKNESAEELKKSQQNEKKLQDEIAALQEVLNTVSQKQEEAAETQNKVKQLSSLIEDLKKQISEKDQQNSALQQTLQKLNSKISSFEIRASKDQEKIASLQLQINSGGESKNQDLLTKLKLTEEKYAMVDKKLVEFQDKYLEEKKKHAKLESLLLKLEESKTEKTGSDLSESREGLQTVNEIHELEAACQKIDEAMETNDKMKANNETLNKQIEVLKKELSQTNENNKRLQESHRRVIEKSIDHCKYLESCCLKVANDYYQLEEKCKAIELEIVSKAELQNEVKETKDCLNSMNQLNDLIAEAHRTKESLESKVLLLEEELNEYKKKYIESHIENTKINEKIKEENYKLNEAGKESNTALISLQKELDEHKSRLVTALDNHKADEKIIEGLEKQLENLKSILERAQKEKESSQMEEVKKSQAVIESLNQQLAALREENKLADDNFSALKSRLDESNRVSESLEQMVTQHCEEYDRMKQKVEAYDYLVPKLQILWNDVKKAKERFNVLKSGVETDLSHLQHDQEGVGSNLNQVVADFVSKLVESNAELLNEMNMMNQSLKERGASISKLEETEQTLRAELKELDNRVKKSTEKLESSHEEVTSLQAQLEARDKTIREMEEEIWRLRSPDAQNDTLSSSTISRVEESQRLADLEESFEEKYNKLKALAVKQKKKLMELQNHAEQERNKLSSERAEFQTKLQTFQVQVNNFNSLQAEYDSLQTKADLERKEATELRKALNKAREELVALKQSNDEHKTDHSKFKQEKETFDMIKKELTGQIQSLKKMLEKEQVKAKERDLEKQQKDQELKSLEKIIEEEKESHMATAASLDEERQKQKMQRVLSLEMAEYERTGTELSKKLEAKENQLRELTASLETQRELSVTLQASMKELERRVIEEREAADVAKEALAVVQNELSGLRVEVSNKTAIVSQVERLAQERAQELDAFKLENASVTADYAKKEESARNKIHNLEEHRAQLQSTLDLKLLELEELKKEFDSYKVRAQSVLRQSQKDGPPGRQHEIEQEVLQLRASYDALKTKYEDAAKKLQFTTEDQAAANEEKVRLSSKVHELQSEVTHLNSVNAELQAAEHRAREQSEEAVRLISLKQETLAQCFKQEIEQLEEKHRLELEAARTAQQQAETALHLHLGRQSSPSHRRQPSNGNSDMTHRRQPSLNFVPVKSERETLDVLMLEREACEGSESVDSASPRVLPLEQLLAPHSPNTGSIDITRLTEKLEKSENRIQHLTTLLSDAEGDAARLQQLNQVLKEEIRRKERNVAREEHAGNLEYLKNVVVKFATLPRGDERLRLVPVLNTILKLSREEEHRLSAAARGENGGAGWGSYLGGMWNATQ